ncbi:hypothetical protein BGW80DRAFT_65109 [Lactifluus volemus]|nr:hypothetical protein BGW80DRAFT_65109 [Lactifluus volemus]
MSFLPFPQRSQFSPASSTSFRPPGQHTAPPTARQQAYSSLGEALGTTERPVLASYSQQPPPPSSSSLPMPSDGRYMYQHQQQGMSPYDYSSYPPNSYDASQFPQTHPRQHRSSQSHPPPPPSDHVPYNPPQPHYHPSYGSAPYAVQHPAPPQWNGEGWTHFSQPVAPPASVQETPAQPPSSRPEPPAAAAPAPAPAPTPASASSSRVYAAAASPQPQPTNTEMRRAAGTPKSADPPSQPKRKPREKEAATPRHSSPLASASLASTSLDIDFGKLIESYRIIIDTTTALRSDPAAGQGRPPSLDALQRISQSAALGVRLLGSPPSTESPGAVPPTEPPVATPGNSEEGDGAAKRQKAEAAAPVPEGQTCLGCNATSTPEWRRGPLGPRTLCNACGLVYAKLIKKRKRDAARRAANTQDTNDGAAADDAGYPSSGDEDESASQEFRMEDDHSRG